MSKLKFIDLFAGLGGFHAALSELGHECVYASEIDGDLQTLYEKNFGIRPSGDIRKIDIKLVPPHDVLCAGFPCQPFSKAGDQKGRECPRWGDLIDYVIKILKHLQPRYFILENVPNLLKHDGGETWKKMKKRLQLEGVYSVEARVLSPHLFGVPQIRKRVFIVGSKTGLAGFSWPAASSKREPSIQPILCRKPNNAKRLSRQVVDCLNVWQEFLDKYPSGEALPTFPIWSMEFGAEYQYSGTTPYGLERQKLPKRLRDNRKLLKSIEAKKSIKALPSHARSPRVRFPKWKREFIRQNRDLYRRHKTWIEPWLPKIRKFPPSLQKFEWNCNSGERNLWKYIIQFRASGVRVKKRTSAPSLVAMTTTQVPIVAWEKRYMTPRECARLQSLIGLRYLPKQSSRAYKALGNAVNAHLVELIARNLLRKPRKIRKRIRMLAQSAKANRKNFRIDLQHKYTSQAA